MFGPVLQALVSRLASGESARQEDGHEAHSLEDALTSMPTPDIQCIELGSCMFFGEDMMDGDENSSFELLDDFQLPPPALSLDIEDVALYLAANNRETGAIVSSDVRAPRAVAVPEEVAHFWSSNLPLVPDSVEGSSQPLTTEDIEEEKAAVVQEFSEGSQAASYADQKVSSAASWHSSPSCARKPAAQLPVPFGQTVRVGRRRVAVRRARQVGTATKRDIGCGGPPHAGRSRRRCQPQVDWHNLSAHCNHKQVIQKDRRI